MEIFWKTIALYNTATWPWQLLLICTGIILTTWLIRKPEGKSRKAMKIFMIVLSLWVAFIYYFIYCDERHYTHVLTLFWCIMAAAWGWDLLSGHTTLQRSHKYDYLGWLLIGMPFIYPVFSLLRGLSFPAITTPVMPCSVAVFMIGILLLYSSRINMFIALLLCHWAIIGFSKTYFFSIPEDFLLASASVPALYLFFREYYQSGLYKEQKPKEKYINRLLIFVCILTCILLTLTLFLNINSPLITPK